MKKYIFKFIEDGKERQKTINAEDISGGLEKLFAGTSGEKLEDIKVNYIMDVCVIDFMIFGGHIVRK